MIKLDTFENKVYRIRKTDVILDRDVAFLYGVETKRINEALKNNPEKFPEGYVFDLSKKEFSDLRSKISTANLQMSRTLEDHLSLSV